MTGSDSPPVGLNHPTVNPNSNAAASARDRPNRCRCNDCGYTVEISNDLPSTCPKCNGALMRVRS